MNVHLLIDAIVRQTTVLIAQLATSGGARAPLSHVANQVFVDLASELERQGLSRQVTADMFGISLRSYQRKVQRLRESSTDRGRSMWEAVLDHLAGAGVVTRVQVLERFHRDPEKLVAGILRDLVDSGLVFRTGTGSSAVHRVASDDELATLRATADARGLSEFLWAHIYRHGPVTRKALSELCAVDATALDRELADLSTAGHIAHDAQGDTYSSARLVVERNATSGWEASVYDHFHAMVSTACARLSGDEEYAGLVGGSTYSFDVGPEHPLREEVLATLADFRTRCSELRKRINDHNAVPTSPSPSERVVVYAGQSVFRTDHEE